jgi:hypothetical protein
MIQFMQPRKKSRLQGASTVVVATADGEVGGQAAHTKLTRTTPRDDYLSRDVEFYIGKDTKDPSYD